MSHHPRHVYQCRFYGFLPNATLETPILLQSTGGINTSCNLITDHVYMCTSWVNTAEHVYLTQDCNSLLFVSVLALKSNSFFKQKMFYIHLQWYLQRRGDIIYILMFKNDFYPRKVKLPTLWITSITLLIKSHLIIILWHSLKILFTLLLQPTKWAERNMHRTFSSRDVLFEYHRADIPSCWAVRSVRSLSTL